MYWGNFSKTSQQGATGTQDEVSAFLKENPTGTADDFNAWKQQRLLIMSEQAKRANAPFNAFATP